MVNNSEAPSSIPTHYLNELTEIELKIIKEQLNKNNIKNFIKEYRFLFFEYVVKTLYFNYHKNKQQGKGASIYPLLVNFNLSQKQTQKIQEIINSILTNCFKIKDPVDTLSHAIKKIGLVQVYEKRFSNYLEDFISKNINLLNVENRNTLNYLINSKFEKLSNNSRLRDNLLLHFEYYLEFFLDKNESIYVEKIIKNKKNSFYFKDDQIVKINENGDIIELSCIEISEFYKKNTGKEDYPFLVISKNGSIKYYSENFTDIKNTTLNLDNNDYYILTTCYISNLDEIKEITKQLVMYKITKDNKYFNIETLNDDEVEYQLNINRNDVDENFIDIFGENIESDNNNLIYYRDIKIKATNILEISINNKSVVFHYCEQIKSVIIRSGDIEVATGLHLLKINLNNSKKSHYLIYGKGLINFKEFTLTFDSNIDKNYQDKMTILGGRVSHNKIIGHRRAMELDIYYNKTTPTKIILTTNYNILEDNEQDFQIINKNNQINWIKNSDYYKIFFGKETLLSYYDHDIKPYKSKKYHKSQKKVLDINEIKDAKITISSEDGEFILIDNIRNKIVNYNNFTIEYKIKNNVEKIILNIVYKIKNNVKIEVLEEKNNKISSGYLMINDIHYNQCKQSDIFYMFVSYVVSGKKYFLFDARFEDPIFKKIRRIDAEKLNIEFNRYENYKNSDLEQNIDNVIQEFHSPPDYNVLLEFHYLKKYSLIVENTVVINEFTNIHRESLYKNILNKSLYDLFLSAQGTYNFNISNIEDAVCGEFSNGNKNLSMNKYFIENKVSNNGKDFMDIYHQFINKKNIEYNKNPIATSFYISRILIENDIDEARTLLETINKKTYIELFKNNKDLFEFIYLLVRLTQRGI